MMKVQLEDAASRHEPVAILIASEAGIYGRFGYGPATAVRALEIDRRAASFRRGAAPDTDPVRLVDRDELRAKAPPIYERWRPRQPGAIGRTDRQWDARLGLTSASPKPDDKFHVLHPDGWLSYRVEDGWDGFLPRSVATVDELVGATPEAYETLWRYCLALDLVSKVVAIDRPVDEPLPWLLADPRQVKVISTYDFLWVRILDVAAALTGRGYAATGRLVIDVVDRFRPSAPATNGVFALEGGVCERVTDAPDLRLEVAALGSVFLGGAGWWALGAARQVEELTPGALARADALFACQPPPWCHTWF
jgi:predicted acetyltransferase